MSVSYTHLDAYKRQALDDLHHFGGDVFLHLVRHGDADIAVSVHFHGGVHGLEEAVRIDACQNETSLVPVSYTHLDVYKRQILE